MAQTFTEALYAMKRKAQLTGNPLTSRNINALTSGYIESATDMMNNQRAVDLQEEALAQTAKANAASLAEAKRQAEESSLQSTLETSAQMSAADRASKNTLTGNLLNTGVTMGGGYLMNNPAVVKAGINALGQATGLWGTAAPAEGAAAIAPATLTSAAAPTGTAVTSASSGAAAGQLSGTATGEGAVAGGSSSSLGGVVAPIAYIAAAELARGQWGGRGIPWEEKTLQQKVVDSPVTAGVVASLAPWAMNEDSGVFKEMSRIERQVMKPIDWLFGGRCIIVTACTDPHSPEVEVTREYRDKFMSADQLRGYYMIAEAIMPWVVRHRTFVRRQFVDRLVEYGRYHLGHTEKMPCRASSCVARLFLGLCGFAGRRKRVFVRCNGEAV